MKKNMVISMALLLLLAAIVFPAAEARAAVRNADGFCYLSPSGKSVSFGGSTSSSHDEDEIKVTVILYEKRLLGWREIARLSATDYNTDHVSVSTTTTVSGGHYYKVSSTHYAKTGTVESSSSCSTAEYWIPA